MALMIAWGIVNYMSSPTTPDKTTVMIPTVANNSNSSSVTAPVSGTPATSSTQANSADSPASDPPSTKKDIQIIAQNLHVPWEIVFLPSGDMLVTERPGTVTLIGKTNRTFTIDGVEANGEGGLLGMALHPDFAKNNWIYLYHTAKNGNRKINRLERYKFDETGFSDKKIIVDNIPAGTFHDGGRILFGPDGFLYITAGDSENSPLSQDKNALAGKILRVTDNGDIPSENPFGNAVWTYGHRNPQGITWDDQGRMWATEHGRSGLLSGLDEVNLIQEGNNYGWPTIQGDEERTGMQKPVINSGSNVTWAPTGIVYYKNRLFFNGLRGESIYEATISGNTITSLKSHLKGVYGRLRALKIGPDGYFYISTSNTDSRGTPQPGDDKIIKINPDYLINSK